MSEHLDERQLLDLDRVKSLGPLFEQARLHLSECAQCRRLRLEAQALQALALESAPELPLSLLRSAFKSVRRSEVEARLREGAGDDVARAILLAASRRTGGPASPALAYALLAAASLAGLGWFALRQEKAPPPAEAQPLPFEFQAGAESPGAQDNPSLHPDEAEEERELETEARRMVAEHLHATAVPAAAAGAPSAAPETPPTPRPQPTAVTLASLPTPRPAMNLIQIAPPSFRMENPRFRLGQGRAQFKLYYPELAPVEIRIFDATGKSVKLLAEGKAGPGDISYSFEGQAENGQTLAPGSYFARVMTRWFSRVETMEILP